MIWFFFSNPCFVETESPEINSFEHQTVNKGFLSSAVSIYLVTNLYILCPVVNDFLHIIKYSGHVIYCFVDKSIVYHNNYSGR